MLVVNFFPPIMKCYRVFRTTGGQNNFDHKFFVYLFDCDPTGKHMAEPGGEKIMTTIRATVSGVISCVVQQLRQSSRDRCRARQRLPAKKNKRFIQSSTCKKEKKKTLSIRNPDLVLPNTQLTYTEPTKRFSS